MCILCVSIIPLLAIILGNHPKNRKGFIHKKRSSMNY